MKKFNIIRLIAVIVIMSFCSLSSGYAINQDIQIENSKALVNLGILKGYPDGTLKLENKIKRSEFFTLIIRVLGYDKSTNVKDVSLPFKDIDPTHWAYKNVQIAFKRQLVKGSPDQKVHPDSFVTYAEAATVLVRALGYENTLQGEWPDNVMNKSSQLGLCKNIDLPVQKQLTRGEMSVLVYNSLTVDLRATD